MSRQCRVLYSSALAIDSEEISLQLLLAKSEQGPNEGCNGRPLYRLCGKELQAETLTVKSDTTVVCAKSHIEMLGASTYNLLLSIE